MRLLDLLPLLGLSLSSLPSSLLESLHIHFLSPQSFASSLPLSSLSPHFLLASFANGLPLLHAHGGPLRVVLGGVVGARWIKWLVALRLDTTPSASPPMSGDYKMLRPPAALDEAERRAWIQRMQSDPSGEERKRLMSAQEPLMSVGIGSAITSPGEGALLELEGEEVEVRGYAVPAHGERPLSRVHFTADAGAGAGSPITQVEVLLLLLLLDASLSLPEIREAAAQRPASSWRAAELQTSPPAEAEIGGGTWGWSLWRCSFPLPRPPHPPGEWAIVVRACESPLRAPQGDADERCDVGRSDGTRDAGAAERV